MNNPIPSPFPDYEWEDGLTDEDKEWILGILAQADQVTIITPDDEEKPSKN